ncbi:hypothetical protein D3C86_927890 [compost metagenome]
MSVKTLGTHRINFTPTGSAVQLWILGPYDMILKPTCYTYPVTTQETYLVDICDEGKDRYRFGFNGQEKVNELAGMGNHNTAEFWEYDTRTALRWNLDPIIKAWESPYSVLSRTPLWKVDPLGNTDYFNQKGNIIYRDQATVGDGRIVIVVNNDVAKQIREQQTISMLSPADQFELPPYDQRQKIKSIIYSHGKKGKSPS